ncbi:hypothetical protein BDA96_02G267100 [Sorghum bicolor]|jgi:hypothetical protein|uniref:DOMON domain-containing protein n=2 Tax=Sorghum bicolor TaxID=4558 RepID=A0A921RSL4_SORBI|nr:auxin-induced in root cultures protein 12 [Sorghum bicolor]EER97001.1 hypothetical protein SORBI_3002G255000 [Sorghum bicolor]KAG0544342.1 hypothetical protein BDA96_02G267100 [Sorghum bicolor]|eukprot:XP_002460480.1 auxin-induced in root cultures protein 12 [Sorghum bicolor]
MAYATTTTQHGRASILVLAVALLLASPATRAATGGCEGDKLPAGKSYAHCAALPYLGAKLHWTYDAKTGSLSVAFVAKPAAGAGGWVSWAVNTKGDGMKGAQALLAFKGGASASAYVVNTYNLTGYAPLPAASTAIAYKATDLAADESGGEVRIYGKLQLGPGVEKVNHIWQVGSTVANGAPAKHAFDKANLQAKGTLVLSGAAQPVEAAPAPAPAGGVGASPATKGGGGGAAPSSGGKSAATAYVSAPALTVLALLAGFLLAIM